MENCDIELNSLGPEALLNRARTAPEHFDAEHVSESVGRLANVGSPREGRYILRALSELANSRPTLLEPHTETVASYLGADDRFVRLLSTEVLSKIAASYPTTIIDHLDSLIQIVREDNSHPWVRLSILQGFRKLATVQPEAFESEAQQLQMLLGDDNPDIRMETANVLTRVSIGFDREFKVSSLASSNDQSVRSGVAIALSELAQQHPAMLESHLAVIEELASDEEALVRREALIALEHLASEHPDSIEHLTDLIQELAQDEVYFVQSHAITVLGMIGSPAMISDLEAIAERSGGSVAENAENAINSLRKS